MRCGRRNKIIKTVRIPFNCIVTSSSKNFANEIRSAVTISMIALSRGEPSKFRKKCWTLTTQLIDFIVKQTNTTMLLLYDLYSLPFVVWILIEPELSTPEWRTGDDGVFWKIFRKLCFSYLFIQQTYTHFFDNTIDLANINQYNVSTIASKPLIEFL